MKKVELIIAYVFKQASPEHHIEKGDIRFAHTFSAAVYGDCVYATNPDTGKVFAQVDIVDCHYDNTKNAYIFYVDGEINFWDDPRITMY